MRMNAAFRPATEVDVRATTEEPRAAAVLCFADVPLSEIGAAFWPLAQAGLPDDDAPAWHVGLVAPSRGAVRTSAGAVVVAAHALADPVRLDALVVPCSFIRSRDFVRRAYVEQLVGAVRRARRVGLFAASRQEARRAQLLLREASSWPPGAFWDALRPPKAGGVTAFVEDGRLSWAIGPRAGADLVARLIGPDRPEAGPE